jgi:hypothetical protein
MYPFGGVIIAPLVAGYLASVFCRLAQARGRRPGFAAYAIPVAVALVIVWVATFGDELLKPWSNGKVSMWGMLLISGVPAFIAGSIPAALIVERFRRNPRAP